MTYFISFFFLSALPLKKIEIRQWKKKNSDFYSTQVCKEVEQRLTTHSVVMVIGHPGTGKSAIIQHIALQYKKEKWILEPLQSITDFENMLSIKNKTIYVINDLFGKHAIKTKEWTFWRKNEETIKSLLTESCSKMLMSCRKYIFLDTRIKRLFEDCSFVVECKLTIDEKKQFLSNYTTDMDFADECANKVEIEAYFPQLCKLYSENHQKKVLEFFLKSEKFLKYELMSLRDENKELFCALIILAISNNNFCKEYLHEIVYSKQNEYISKQCGMSAITPYSIMEKLDSMDGFLVKKKNPDNTDGTNFTKDTDIYVFHNEVVRGVTESCFEDIITQIKKKN